MDRRDRHPDRVKAVDRTVIPFHRSVLLLAVPGFFLAMYKAFEVLESSGNDTGIGDTTPETDDFKTFVDNTGIDTDRRYTPAFLTSEQLTGIVKQMVDKKMSQTQIIQSLWGVEKNGKGWKQAYTEYKELFP